MLLPGQWPWQQSRCCPANLCGCVPCVSVSNAIVASSHAPERLVKPVAPRLPWLAAYLPCPCRPPPTTSTPTLALRTASSLPLAWPRARHRRHRTQPLMPQSLPRWAAAGQGTSSASNSVAWCVIVWLGAGGRGGGRACRQCMCGNCRTCRLYTSSLPVCCTVVIHHPRPHRSCHPQGNAPAPCAERSRHSH